MKKTSLLLGVLLFPVLASAQYMGYNPMFHDPQVQQEGMEQISTSWKKFWNEQLPEAVSGQNGKDAFVPAWVQMSPAAKAVQERAEKESRKVAQKAQDKPKVLIGEKEFDNPVFAMSYCGGIAAEALESGVFPQQMQGVLTDCQAVEEVMQGAGSECVAPTAIAQARDEGKGWFRKMVGVYLQGCASQASAADAERVAASQTVRGVVDVYLQGCQTQGQSYVFQTEMNQKTLEDLGKLWNRFTAWLENLYNSCQH